MELKDHWKIVQHHKWFVIGFTICVGVAAFFFSLYRPDVYKINLSFDVKAVNQQAATDYEYGSYYDLKAAEIFTQNVMGWLMTADTVVDIYKAADVGYTIENIDQFTNRFKAKQLGAQNFVVTYTDTSRNNGEKLAKGMVNVLEDKSEEILVNQDGQPVFTVVGSEAVIVQSNFGPFTTTVVGLIVGLVLAIILVYMHKYFVGEGNQQAWL